MALHCSNLRRAGDEERLHHEWKIFHFPKYFKHKEWTSQVFSDEVWFIKSRSK